MAATDQEQAGQPVREKTKRSGRRRKLPQYVAGGAHGEQDCGCTGNTTEILSQGLHPQSSSPSSSYRETAVCSL